MTADQETALPSLKAPELDRVFDALARLDGKVRVIVDRFGHVLAGPGGVLSRSEHHGKQDVPRLRRQAAAGGGATARLLAVRGEETEIAVFDSDQGNGPILVRAAAVDDDHVCLVLTVPGRNGSPPIRELQSLFGLTDCEARIVMDLMDGCAPQTIAERRSNSIHTIRAHIRECHRKIGVNTREELFSRVASLCL